MSERNTKLFDSPFNQTREGRAAIATFEKGHAIFFGSDDGLIKPYSGSQKLVAVGRCEESKVVSAADYAASMTVKYTAGLLVMSNSAGGAVDNTDVGQPCWFDGANTVTDVASTNPLAGRVYQHGVDGVADVVVHMDHHLFPSGTIL